MKIEQINSNLMRFVKIALKLVRLMWWNGFSFVWHCCSDKRSFCPIAWFCIISSYCFVAFVKVFGRTNHICNKLTNFQGRRDKIWVQKKNKRNKTQKLGTKDEWKKSGAQDCNKGHFWMFFFLFYFDMEIFNLQWFDR